MLTTDATDNGIEEPGNQRPVWIRRHPVLSVLLGIVAVVLVDLALLPFPTLISYERERPDVTAFQQAYLDGRMGGKPASITKEWIPYRSIPRHLVRAVLVSEDASFWKHSGFDTFEIQQSVSDAVSEGRGLRGASTITQQLVKNLFLSSSRNPLRKVNEAILTVVAERALGKRRILELYLNEIEWGPGVYGVQAAARYYFGVSAQDLNRWQSAFLASIIPSPTRYKPDAVTPYLQRRISLTLRRMGVSDEPSDTTVPSPQPVEPDSLEPMTAVPDSSEQTPE